MIKKILEVIDYRELILNLAVRDLKIRYKGSLLGFFWSLLNPLLMMLVLFFVFSIIFKVQIENFQIFLLAGILPWHFFSIVLTDSTKTIIDNANLIKKIYFPREVLTISIILSNLVNFLLSLIILFVFILLFHIKITPWALLLPLIILVQIIFLFGIGLISSALNVFYRDVTWIVNVLLLLWFYFTPIFYSTTMVPQKFLNLYMLNPMAVLVTSYRDILLYGKAPNITYLLITLLSSLMLFFIGMKIYQRYSSVFAEEV